MAVSKPNNDQQQFNEPEEKQPPVQTAQVVPPDEEMLTGEAKIDRSHASTTSTGPTVSEHVPPAFTGVIIDDDQQEREPPKPSDHPMANPGLRDASPQTKQKGAEFIADKLLQGYGKGKTYLGEWIVLISEKKIDRLEEKGLVDRSIPIELNGGQMVLAGAVISSHNQMAEQVIKENALTQDFYDEAKPMIVEELVKRDIALTNAQQLMAITAMDLYNFGEKLKPLFFQGQEIIGAFKEATAAWKGSGGGHAAFPPAPQPAPQPAGPAAPPQEAAQPVAQPQAQQPASPDPVLTNDPNQMFDAIQGQNRDTRTATGPIVTGPAGRYVPPVTHQGLPLKIKKIRKRGPYKKKAKLGKK